MEHVNPLNVYQGPDSLKKYYDPDCQPLIPLVEIPDILNPFRPHGVRIYAKMMTALPAQNVKALAGEILSMAGHKAFISRSLAVSSIEHAPDWHRRKEYDRDRAKLGLNGYFIVHYFTCSSPDL
jgi:hypothetical protein